MRRLRVSHVVIQPVLVWDDGDELTAGPPAQPRQLSIAELRVAADALLEQVANIEEELLASEPEADEA